MVKDHGPDQPLWETDQSKGNLFDQEAELYDRLRPGYPENFFDVLVEATSLSDGASLLEIGCGTGQATLPMAQRRYRITAIEKGPHMAELTRQKLQAYPSAKVLTGGFEETELPAEGFDLIYAASSFHWIRPEYKFAKTHRLLKPGGFLAIIRNEPVTNGSDRFYEASDPIFKRYGITLNDLSVREIDELGYESFDADLFDFMDFYVTRPPNVYTYTSARAYSDYLRTVSIVLNMPEDQRAALLREIQELIESEFDNKLETHYSPTLALARKK